MNANSMTTMTTTTHDNTSLMELLRQVLARHAPLAVAVSGGVDSLTLAAIACSVDPGTEVFHARSPAVPELATIRVRNYAAQFGWRLHEIDAGEMHDPDYQRNPANRCYYCKTNLYSSINKHTSLAIASGTNLDDLQDYRPGLLAATEQQVIHPFVEAGINKTGVRQLAAMIGLHELSELPASPCLSSRITTGIAIDADLLPLIDATEERLRTLLGHAGSESAIRCRIRNTGIAIQINSSFSVTETQICEAVQHVFSNTRFARYSAHISIEPYRQGSAFIRADS
jgi:pyridinium-3,5-biscarboxylic acid mononucleotide sulfurtransferase